MSNPTEGGVVPDTEQQTPEMTEKEKVAAAAEAAQQRQDAIRESEEHGVLAPARLGWDPAQVAAMKRTVAKDCNDAEFVMFLEVAARYQLDPFAKQIYAAKMGKGPEAPVAIIVSRDGLLAHAHRQEDFENMVGDVVHEGDTFKVSYTETGERLITHEYEGWKDRGAIVGSWTVVKRKGHGTTYFFAPFSEYKGERVWNKNPSAMILKVAETYALRKAYSISGVVGEEEVEDERQNLTTVPGEPDWGTDEELAERLKADLERAREIDPGRWRPRKVETLMQGASQEDREAFAEELDAFITEHADPVPTAAA